MVGLQVDERNGMAAPAAVVQVQATFGQVLILGPLYKRVAIVVEAGGALML